MVAIKGMEIPKGCWNCNFCFNKDGYYCAISNDLLADEAADIPDENRPTDCPLVEIITCKDCKYYRIEDDNEPLDKIRAEIIKKHLSIVEKNDFDSGRTYNCEEVLDIIDKYKTEMENKK